MTEFVQQMLQIFTDRNFTDQSAFSLLKSGNHFVRVTKAHPQEGANCFSCHVHTIKNGRFEKYLCGNYEYSESMISFLDRTFGKTI